MNPSKPNDGTASGRQASEPDGVSRRDLIATATISAAALAAGNALATAAHAAEVGAEPASRPVEGSARIDVVLRVNGAEHPLTLDARVSLLDALREHLNLTGTKKGCDHGQCGACTVLLEGRRVNSCLLLAAMVNGKPIVTVEGLAHGEQLHPVQSAFIEHDAFQCGYCTPGQICSAVGLLGEGHAHSDDDIREQMSGNICRCGAYPNIVDAVASVLHSPQTPGR